MFGVVPVIGFNPQRIILPIGLKFVLAAFTRYYLSVGRYMVVLIQGGPKENGLFLLK